MKAGNGLTLFSLVKVWLLLHVLICTAHRAPTDSKGLRLPIAPEGAL